MVAGALCHLYRTELRVPNDEMDALTASMFATTRQKRFDAMPLAVVQQKSSAIQAFSNWKLES